MTDRLFDGLYANIRHQLLSGRPPAYLAVLVRRCAPRSALVSPGASASVADD